MVESIGLRVEDPRFWDEADLRGEVDRIFDVCAGCRLCFKFCGSFPRLFELLDGKTGDLRETYLRDHPEVAERAAGRRAAAAADPQPESEERAGAEVGVTFGDELPEIQARAGDLSDGEVDGVVDLCFQCKLCYPNCPYTPPHDFALDFPRLLLRWKAHRTRRDGVPLRTRLMRDTETIGKAASLVPRLANWSLRNRPLRVVMETVLGIHRDKRMPRYHRETFPKWWRAHRPAVEAAQDLKSGIKTPTPLSVVLFSTCLVDYNDPAVGRAAVQVLEHCGVEVEVVSGVACCGMPFLDGGDVEAAAAVIRGNVELLHPYVERGYRVVVPSPSCSLMIREEFPQLVSGERSSAVAAAAHDLDEYLYRIAREGRLKRDFVRKFGSVRYHVPCHIRAQNIGIRGRDLLELVADEVLPVEECSGHDGTWSMQREHFEDSMRWGEKAFAGMRSGAGEPCSLACSGCRLAGLHIEQGAGRETVHPVVALAHAYGFDVGLLDSKPA